MSNRYVKKIITVLSCAVFAALFIITLYFAAPKIETVPETSGELTELVYSDGVPITNTYKIGTDVSAVRISDLTEIGKITTINYVADKFVAPGHFVQDMQIVDLTKPFEFAEKGTLILVIANLDPMANNFDEQTERLAKYKIGDYWRFTLQLPKIFSASNVYQKANLVARNGEIENYDFAEYNTSYDIKTDKFSSQTDTTYINLQFYTRREALANSFSAAQIITIHYQSSGGAYSGIANCPLIGTESAVTGTFRTSQNLLLLFAILAAVASTVLVVLSIVERSNKFVSAIVWILAITGMLLSRYLLNGVTLKPLFWTATSLAMSFVILVGAQLAMGRNFGKIPTKYIFPAISAVGALLAFIYPFISFGAASAMRIVCLVIKAIGAAALTAFIGISLFDKKDGHEIFRTVCTSIIDVGIIASLFLPQIFPTKINPIFWISAVATVLTFFSVVIVIMDMKKSNVYLTDNLHKEVERQVKDIKAVITERDNLLQFVSHDMKKPLVSAVTLLNTTIEREKDVEQKKALEIVKQHGLRVVNNLSEIGEYARFNYLAEPSQITDLSEICALLYKYHKLDCDANGIILRNTTDGPTMAFVKKQGLENVVSNIIMNAVEHANCKTITLSVKTDKNRIVLCVADDGKGMRQDIDVFAPYVTENNEKEDTGGLGLYICKSIIESMNGELTYETGKNGTAFFIALLKA